MNDESRIRKSINSVVFDFRKPERKLHKRNQNTRNSRKITTVTDEWVVVNDFQFIEKFYGGDVMNYAGP